MACVQHANYGKQSWRVTDISVSIDAFAVTAPVVTAKPSPTLHFVVTIKQMSDGVDGGVQSGGAGAACKDDFVDAAGGGDVEENKAVKAAESQEASRATLYLAIKTLVNLLARRGFKKQFVWNDAKETPTYPVPGALASRAGGDDPHAAESDASTDGESSTEASDGASSEESDDDVPAKRHRKRSAHRPGKGRSASGRRRTSTKAQSRRGKCSADVKMSDSSAAPVCGDDPDDEPTLVYGDALTPLTDGMLSAIQHFRADRVVSAIEKSDKFTTLITAYVTHPLQVGTTAEAAAWPENTKCMVMFAPKGNIAAVRDVLEEAETKDADQVILVLRNALTPQSKALAARSEPDGIRVDCYTLHDLQGNIAEHKGQPTQVPLNAAAAAKTRERYANAVFPMLRAVKSDPDPMVRYMGYPLGTIVTVLEARGLAQSVRSYWEVREA